MLARRIRDLEGFLRGPQDQGDAAGRVDDVVEIAERLDLVADVMQRRRRAVGGLHAETCVGEAARHEHAVGPPGAAVFGAGLVHVVTAAIDRHVAAGLEAALGGDVDDPGGAQAILRRQGAGEQVDVGRQAGAEGLAEHRQALGEDHIVQPVLDVVVVAADVQLAERILGRARRLQDDLVELDVLAARQVVDQLRRQRIGRGSQRGLDGLARGVEPAGGDHHLGDRGAGGRGRVWNRGGVGDADGRSGQDQAGGGHQHQSQAHAGGPLARGRPGGAVL